MFYSGKKIKCKLQHGNWKLITKNWKARKLETKIPRSTAAAAAAAGAGGEEDQHSEGTMQRWQKGTQGLNTQSDNEGMRNRRRAQPGEIKHDETKGRKCKNVYIR